MGLFGSLFRDKSRDEEFCRYCEVESAENVSKALESWGFAEAKDEQGKSALMHAAESNTDGGVIGVLLRNGASVEATFNGLTALMTAVKADNIEAVKAFVARKETLDARDSEGHTALYYALSDRFNPEIFDVLRKGGAKIDSPNSKNQTLLMEFVGMKANNSDVVEALIKAGADVNFLNADSTVLMSAIDSGKPEKIIAVLEAGVDVNKKLPDDTTALFYVSGLKTPEAADIVKLLLAHGADVDSPKGVDFALDHAIKAGNTEIAQILRAAGGIRNFAWLCSNGTFDEVLNELKVRRVDVNATWGDVTPLMFALENDDVDVLRLLIEAGANINACRKIPFKGMCTVLDLAKIKQISPFGKAAQRVKILRSFGAKSLHPELWK